VGYDIGDICTGADPEELDQEGVAMARRSDFTGGSGGREWTLTGRATTIHRPTDSGASESHASSGSRASFGRQPHRNLHRARHRQGRRRTGEGSSPRKLRSSRPAVDRTHPWEVGVGAPVSTCRSTSGQSAGKHSRDRRTSPSNGCRRPVIMPYCAKQCSGWQPLRACMMLRRS